MRIKKAGVSFIDYFFIQSIQSIFSVKAKKITYCLHASIKNRNRYFNYEDLPHRSKLLKETLKVLCHKKQKN